jgi:signal recognition particle receptor subunit alpha
LIIALFHTRVCLCCTTFILLSYFYVGGIVLWSRSFTPSAAQVASSSASPVNALIREALIEGRTADDKYEKDGYAVKWTFVNDLELIFVVRAPISTSVHNINFKNIPQVAYQRILQLTYVEDLLAALKTVFVQLFGPFLSSFVASLHATGVAALTNGEQMVSWDFAKALEGWDNVFDKLLRGLEEKAAQVHMLSPSHLSCVN